MLTALHSQFRVVGALVLREAGVRYGRSRLGYIWAFAEPVAYIVVLSFAFSFIRGQAPFGKSWALFFALGITPFSLFRNLTNRLTMAIVANKSLLNFPVVKILDTIFARALLEVITSLFVMMAVLSGIYMFGDIPPPSQPLNMLVAVAIMTMLGLGIGLINAVLNLFFSSWKNIYQLLTTPMLILSGVFYSLESMPENARSLLVWNPVIHGVEALRDGYYSNYRANFIDISYLFWVGFFALLIGLALERVIRIKRS